MPPPATIDSATKVNLGILLLMVGGIGGGGVYLGTLRADVVEVRKSIERMEQAVASLSAQSSSDGREVVALRSEMKALERRLTTLEGKVK